MGKKMTAIVRLQVFFIFFLLLFYEINRMYPKDPIIRFPIIFLFLLFLLAVKSAFTRTSFPQKNAAFFYFIALECAIMFFLCEHSLFYSLSSSSVYLTTLLPLLLFLFSYNITVNGNDQFLPKIAIPMTGILSIVFFTNHRTGVDELLSVDAGSYVILYYIPFILCLKKVFFKTFCILLCLIAVLLSFKRGGIICLFAGLYVYAVVCVISASDWLIKLKRFCISLIPLFVIILCLFLVNDFSNDLIFTRFSKMESGGGSGRDVIYAHVLEMISSSSWYELLVGHGWNTVSRDSYLGLSAHNDFLECIYDYGVITFIAYLALYINLIRLMLDMLKRNSIYAAPLAASIVMFLTNSLVSHILLYDWHFITFAMFWGYIIACDEKEVRFKCRVR